ncbi:MAG TPA: tail fiber domain-containing protein, partial [Verrucomicrobiae bacterium]|nr:tail fiber domain-containing protein [Verrucomicrobiae bacterium]
MKNPNVSAALLLVGLCTLPLLPTPAHASNHLLPFQGRLTDANGQAIADGARVVQFKIYDAPVGGRAVWNGEVQKLSVNGGLVSTLLGTKADLSAVDFNRQIYLELTVDANGDGSITPADPPLLPRQSVLPAVFAVESGNSRLLEGHGWSALFGTNNPAEGTLLDTKIGDGSLTAAKLHDNAVTAAKIANGAVTRAKLDTTGAQAGQLLSYDGTQVVWGGATATNAMRLNGFDWTALFNNGNPQSGSMSVAAFSSRGSALVNGELQVEGRCLLRGPTVTVLGSLFAPNIGFSMYMTDNSLYLRNNGDNNHYLRYANAYAGQSGFDGPLLAGVNGGILAGFGNWSLRWNGNGSVQTRGSISQGSDRNIKENFASVDPDDVLSKVTALPITRWNYKDDPSAEHMGPVAQDFRAAFGLGSDDKSICVVDSDGVALAAIQGLNKKVEQKSSELLDLVKQQKEQIDLLKAEIE